MKKIALCFVLGLILSANTTVEARYCHSHHYITYKDYFQEEQNFRNCDRHYAVKETTVYYYSSGGRSTYETSTIFNSDGTVLISECSNIKHITYQNKHYFILRKQNCYQIIDEQGFRLNQKAYKSMTEIAPNRLLVKYDGKFGVIDLNENTIVPIKYKKFERVGQNLFITKLNGYYGICDSSNNILVKNENDKISALYDTFIIENQNKYGLTDKNGKIILQLEYDKIKKLGEYILIEKNNKYGVLDSAGNIIAEPIYKKIRLERNHLEGKVAGNSWQSLL